MSISAHNVFQIDDVCFSSNFDSGNLAKVEKVAGKPFDYKIWTAPDNMGSSYQSKHSAWFHFQVSGIPTGSTMRIQFANTGNYSALYKNDMVRQCPNFLKITNRFILISVPYFEAIQPIKNGLELETLSNLFETTTAALHN